MALNRQWRLCNANAVHGNAPTSAGSIMSNNPISGRFAVVGNPIHHSLSPTIHSAFAAQTGQQIDYRAELLAIDSFETWVGHFFERGGVGLNVTLPFKSRAFEFANQISARAQMAGAANFLMRGDGGQIIADNTDGKGLVTDITVGAGWALEGARILIVGAGGAVKGVVPALLEAAPAEILIVNRTPERAASLASEWSSRGARIQGGGLDAAAAGTWNLVINGTSTGLSGEMPRLSDSMLLADACCYDMAYGAGPTPFMRWAEARGAAAVRDGLGMLVEQAAESFYLWLGNYPDTSTLIDTLRALRSPD